MNKTMGSSVAFVALVAVLLHSAGPSHNEPASPSGPKHAQPLPSTLPQSGSTSAPSDGGQGPWSATQQYFHQDARRRADGYAACVPGPTEACSRQFVLDLYGLPASFDLNSSHAVIATVPDPLHTRMAMETDRALEAIQQAVFDSGYELATQWLPWTSKVAAEKAAAQSADALGVDWERMPGLLVLRPHFEPGLANLNSLLLVFVVGETPTAGVNGFQFAAARDTIFALEGNNPHDLYVAGPVFSGSFLSLTRLLEDKSVTGHVEVRAGPAASSDYARAMLLHLKSNGFTIDQRCARSLTFYASNLPRRSFRENFKRLVSRIPLPPDKAAEITEDETGFSFIPEDAGNLGDNPTIYRYSRNIAQLRNTYNDAAFAPAQDGDTKTATPVEFSLKDAQTGEDAFPTFSTNHTAVWQEAVLDQIAERLKNSPVRLVSLSATNVFDEIFIARILSRSCPDVRLVLEGGDLLFAEEAAAGSLSGLLAISPFPLFSTGAQDARIPSRQNGKQVRDITTFSSSSQIAEFDAMLALLKPFSKRDNKAYRQDYGPALKDVDIGSSWLLVLSSRGWMPVDLLPESDGKLKLKEQTVTWFDPAQHSPEVANGVEALLGFERGWMALCVLAAVGSLAFCARLYSLAAQPNKPVWSSLCLADLDGATRTTAMKPVLHGRYFCMIACFVCLSLANAFLLCPMVIAWRRHADLSAVRDKSTLGIVALAFLACALTSLWLAVRTPVKVLHTEERSGLSSKTDATWLTIVILRALLFLLSATAVYLWWTSCNRDVAGTLLCFRTLTLASPVSPIWPLLLGIAGLFSLAYFHLQRFTWGHRRQPKLDTATFDKPLCGEFLHIKCRFENALLSSVCVAGVPALLIVASVGAVLGVGIWIVLPPGSLSSFEPARLLYLLRIEVLLLATYTAVTLYRFAWCWSLLRAFLVALNSVVLGRYFMRVPEFGGGKGPVWIRGVKLMSLATAVNSCIALHNLEKIRNGGTAYSTEYMDKLRGFLSAANNPTSRSELMAAYEQFREEANAIAVNLGDKILNKYWAANQLPFVGDTAPPDVAAEAPRPTESTPHATSMSEALDPEPANEGVPSAEAYEQASRFVALHYSAYIGYALHQLQNLLICSVVCFVLLVLALSAFDFQAPQAIFRLVVAGLIIGGSAVMLAFAQMERDPVLSRLSGTQEGELGKNFYVRALTFGAVPVMTVLTTQFPAISRYASVLVQPLTSYLH